MQWVMAPHALLYWLAGLLRSRIFSVFHYFIRVVKLVWMCAGCPRFLIFHKLSHAFILDIKNVYFVVYNLLYIDYLSSNFKSFMYFSVPQAKILMSKGAIELCKALFYLFSSGVKKWHLFFLSNIWALLKLQELQSSLTNRVYTVLLIKFLYFLWTTTRIIRKSPLQLLFGLKHLLNKFLWKCKTQTEMELGTRLLEQSLLPLAKWYIV